jgi:nucleoside 2-deoxyribosyltransferase
MQCDLRFLVIGEVYTDVHLYAKSNGKSVLRLGGIFHSARSFDAFSQEYSLAVIAPSYLKESINKFSSELSVSHCFQIGVINNCPNVMLIADSLEAGDQGYNDILREQSVSSINVDELIIAIKKFKPTDVIVYPGKFLLSPILETISKFKCRLHIDFQYGEVELSTISSLGITLDTFILSTSAKYFKEECNNESLQLVEQIESKYSKSILLKENRGGSRLFLHQEKTWVTAPSFPVDTVHSVGVGDCYNSVFLKTRYQQDNIRFALKQAAYSASLYASTWIHDEFKELINFLPNKEELLSLSGIELPWEVRKEKHLYIAAPDFPDVDTTWIDNLCNVLVYHNFSPRRPVKENGLIRGNEPELQQLLAYEKDIKLLNDCSMLIAVLLNDDPGTYVEIGWMAKSGKPTVLFDPFKRSYNLFLRKTVTQVCYTLGEVIDAVYQLISKGEEQVE